MADPDGHADILTPAPDPARVFAFSLSFFTDRHLRRSLAALGLKPRFGLPRAGDTVLVWGRRPVARRGMAIARARGARVLTVEDAFLRSVRTGREKEPSHGFVADDLGIYFDTAAPSRLSDLMNTVARDGPDDAAERALARWRDAGLSKYNAPGDTYGLPDSFVLVVDQTAGDASIAGAGAGAADFARMLDQARADHPDALILIKTHPETLAGRRAGHFRSRDGDARTLIWSQTVRPADLLARASAVYCVSSLLGLESILHGHRPVVFGDAFYAGRGLSDDRHPRTPSRPALTAAGLFDACYLRYCRWVDPAAGRRADIGVVIDQLGDCARAARMTGTPTVMAGMRLWKRGFLRRMFPALVRFDNDPQAAAVRAARAGGTVTVWAGRETEALQSACAALDVGLVRMEDGFIRSAGLGADLVPPASLALDDLGIYYDPARESRLERLIDAARELPPDALDRAARLRQAVAAAGVSKYNLMLAAGSVAAPEGRSAILVPGQVEDDQSVLKGAGDLNTNAALLAAVRDAFPDAWIVYKPHPDVVAGLRDGGMAGAQIADQVIERADISALLGQVDRVATLTSLTGFEALLRGVPVTVFGQPFYAGWGLTDDRVAQPARRLPGVPLDGLVHAALIAYPSYWDPVTGLPCRAELVVERLSARIPPRRSARLRWLAKAQGALASWAHLWR